MRALPRCVQRHKELPAPDASWVVPVLLRRQAHLFDLFNSVSPVASIRLCRDLVSAGVG